MSDGDHEENPRAALRTAVRAYLDELEVIGRRSDCDVVFRSDQALEAQVARGVLLRAPRPDGGVDRYVLLADGDVWHEVVPTNGNTRPGGWLQAPDEDVVTLLSRSLANARRGGGAFFADESREIRRRWIVADRRRESRPFAGTERRTG